MRRGSFLLSTFFLGLTFGPLARTAFAEHEKVEAGGSDPIVFSKNGGPLNFGLVLKNSDYTIYRSSMLGRKGLATMEAYLERKGLPFPKTIIYMNKDGYKRTLPFFDLWALEEYYNQKNYGYKYYHSFDYSYRTYLDGEDPYHPSEDIDGSKNLGKNAIRLFGVRKDPAHDGGVDALFRVLKLILDKNNQPVLFHCLGGRHRTGMIAMALRYLQGGEWVNGKKRKIFILPSLSYRYLNPAQYEYALHNRELFRTKNINFIEELAQDPRFLELKEKYGEALRSDSSSLPESIYGEEVSTAAEKDGGQAEVFSVMDGSGSSQEESVPVHLQQEAE